MALLALPAELRLRIYDYIPDLQLDAQVFISQSSKSLTPPISRTTHILRHETLPLYAASSQFCIDIAGVDTLVRERINTWQTAVGSALTQVQALRLSRTWDIAQPSTGQGHVGFYLDLKRSAGPNTGARPRTWSWSCKCGTFPTANDLRGMRLESVELVQSIMLHVLNGSSAESSHNLDDHAFELSQARLDMVINAIDIVASHPISTYDIYQGDDGRRRRLQAWERMERQLQLLTGMQTTKRVYTPY